jgi:hypothetical protein
LEAGKATLSIFEIWCLNSVSDNLFNIEKCVGPGCQRPDCSLAHARVRHSQVIDGTRVASPYFATQHSGCHHPHASMPLALPFRSRVKAVPRDPPLSHSRYTIRNGELHHFFPLGARRRLLTLNLLSDWVQVQRSPVSTSAKQHPCSALLHSSSPSPPVAAPPPANLR